MSTLELSPAQAHALFDILTHHETYSEIQQFRWPNAIHEYGPPFVKDPDKPPTSPVLQTLLRVFGLQLPGLKNVSKEFWTVRVQTLVEKLASAELSESYDKGTLGSRKTLATACGALFEYPARGILGGYPKRSDASKEADYDVTKAEDIMRGWDDFLQSMIYGDGLDELFKKAAETDKLEDHTPVVQAAHEYLLVK
jgi:hypothetical protein